ncbi:hypothetical protein EK0264_18580 [Epidermidibacterium keratini]|uniref:Uncharacterized protein n=1 Tax=Epidermidibacterium keratini TaxID=1891644 RepID=A0A7L4YUJ2_9ACTN|nr:hypothetical protein [Epidermidibacterium keratini]QHC02077.1 hypothetical protein EK0264_18580 [Epidermidibacterium keratini]
MTYRYGRDWHPVLKKPIAEITETEAKQRWAKGPAFSVSKLSPGHDQPDYTLLVGPEGEVVRTQRYRPTGAIDTIYTFRPEAGQMFLNEVVAYAYPDDAKYYDQFQSAAVSTIGFRPDGGAVRRFSVSGSHDARVSRYTDVDVSAHWEPMITFGDWDRFGVGREPTGPTAP